jgi:hypothetical protein
LYTFEGDFRAFKAHIAAEYNGIALTRKNLDAGSSEAATLSPLGKLPVLATAAGTLRVRLCVCRCLTDRPHLQATCLSRMPSRVTSRACVVTRNCTVLHSLRRARWMRGWTSPRTTLRSQRHCGCTLCWGMRTSTNKCMLALSRASKRPCKCWRSTCCPARSWWGTTSPWLTSSWPHPCFTPSSSCWMLISVRRSRLSLAGSSRW